LKNKNAKLVRTTCAKWHRGSTIRAHRRSGSLQPRAVPLQRLKQWHVRRGERFSWSPLLHPITVVGRVTIL